MTANLFYNQLLDEIAVPLTVMAKARSKRDTVGGATVAELRKRLGTARAVAVGALAQGTQIAPLNDFDLVAEVEQLMPGWIERPQSALSEVRSWIEPVIEGTFETSAHAIKITFPNCEFTADIVLGLKQQKGLLIPHCPDDQAQGWIRTDPETHKLQVLGRNEQFDSSEFTREVRILKWLNEYWQLIHELEKKPLPSFHVTALALRLLTTRASHADWTPYFLENAATLVLQPLADPAGVGDPLEARDPRFASRLLRDAAVKTKQALTATPEEAERLLRDVFGYPMRIREVEEKPSVGIGRGGALGVAASLAHRHTPHIRSHGGGGR
jgi:hypothetical protein